MSLSWLKFGPGRDLEALRRDQVHDGVELALDEMTHVPGTGLVSDQGLGLELIGQRWLCQSNWSIVQKLESVGQAPDHIFSITVLGIERYMNKDSHCLPTFGTLLQGHVTFV